jgi:proteasome accessory factor C
VSAPRLTASGRVQRLLAVVQYASAHPEGVPVVELCERFRMRRDDLVRELEMASLIGAESSPYADEMPIEFFLEDGLVFVHLRAFHRPLRLTPAEALTLLAAIDALADQSGGAGADTPLGRAAAKLAAHLGAEPGTEVDVVVDPDGGQVGRALRRAVDDRRVATFTYWTYGRDEVASRRVEPWDVYEHEGQWYAVGWDLDRGGERRFRLDRADDVVVTDQEASAPRPVHVERIPTMADDAPQVVLELDPTARWVADAHPVVSVVSGPADHLIVTLAVSGVRWLERLLLRLDGSARILEIDARLGGPDLAARAAARVLARYQH